jgi:hypothetical protein
MIRRLSVRLGVLELAMGQSSCRQLHTHKEGDS